MARTSPSQKQGACSTELIPVYCRILRFRITWITCLFSDLLKLTLFCDSVIFSLFKGSRKVSGPLHGYILWECLLSNSQPALLTLFHGLHFCQKKRKKYKQPKPQTKSHMRKKNCSDRFSMMCFSTSSSWRLWNHEKVSICLGSVLTGISMFVQLEYLVQ